MVVPKLITALNKLTPEDRAPAIQDLVEMRNRAIFWRKFFLV